MYATMKKGLLVLSVIFILLTFAGAIYVISSKGEVNAGYAVIPMVFALASMAGYRGCKKK